jgi:hypothetical protein
MATGEVLRQNLIRATAIDSTTPSCGFLKELVCIVAYMDVTINYENSSAIYRIGDVLTGVPFERHYLFLFYYPVVDFVHYGDGVFLPKREMVDGTKDVQLGGFVFNPIQFDNPFQYCSVFGQFSERLEKQST